MTKIIQKDDPVLRKEAAPVYEDEFGSDELARTLSDMKETVESQEDGVAIAAPQIGVSKQIFVVSRRGFAVSDEERGKPLKETYADRVYINPEIVSRSKKTASYTEGCLSVRWWYGTVERAEKVTVRAQDENGNVFTEGASGILAEIFQHEIDHLHGILFTDHAHDLQEFHPDEVNQTT